MQATYEPTDLAALTRDLASTFRSAMEKAGLAFAVECAPLPQHGATSIARCGKRSSSTCSRTRSSSRSSGGVTLTLARRARQARCSKWRTPASAFRQRSCRACSSASIVSRRRKAARTKVPASALRSCRSSCRLHGGTIDATSTLGAGTTFRVRIPFGTAHLPQDRIRAAATPTPMAIASAFVEEALRWLPDAGRRDGRSMRADTAAPADRRFAATFGSRIVLADDNADMRAYVRDLLAPYYLVETVADGDAGARRRAARDARSHPQRRHDAAARRLRAARGRARRCRAAGACRSCCCRRAPARNRASKASIRVPTTTSSSRSRRASCSRGSARCSSFDACGRRRICSSRLRTAQFETLLNEAPLGVYLVDADFVIRDANPTARAAFGGVPDPIGRDFADASARIWPRDLAEESLAIFRHTLETGEPFCDARARRAAARPRHDRILRVADQPHSAAGRRLRRRLLFPRHLRRTCARASSSNRRTGRRTSSWPCSRTSCAIRWRRSATPARCCHG